MTAMKRQLPSQTLEEQFFNPDTRRAPLSETIRLGAQLMLQKAVELEVTEFLGRDHYQRSTDCLLRGYRNGYEDKQVQTGEGPLHLKMPQVRNTIDAFESVWLRSLVRRRDRLAALIPQLYIKGMSTRDIEAALSDTLEIEGVSKSTVSALCGQLKHDFDRWQNRDLSAVDLLYLFCDGIYLRLRPEDPKAVAVLCAYGIKSDGRKVLLHLAVGDKESTVCWKSFFEDLKQRGLTDPLLTVIDGNSGLRKAVRECLPGSWVQRCQVHRMRNILCKLPEKARPGLKKLIQKACTAQSHKSGLEQAQAVVAMYREQFPEAMKCLATGLEECLTALRFPETHRKRIRTTNLLERLFGEGQRRSKVIPQFMNERSGLSLMFAVLVDASAGWRGVKMTPAVSQELEALRTSTKAQPANRLAA
jgi:transposase-like protein